MIILMSIFSFKPKKPNATVTTGLTDELLKAGWAPADIEYPFVFKCLIHSFCVCMTSWTVL